MGGLRWTKTMVHHECLIQYSCTCVLAGRSTVSFGSTTVWALGDEVTMANLKTVDFSRNRIIWNGRGFEMGPYQRRAAPRRVSSLRCLSGIQVMPKLPFGWRVQTHRYDLT